MSNQNDSKAVTLSEVSDSAAVDDETLTQDAAAIERSQQLSRQIDEPPAQVPGYAISRCLGNGAYGSVWLAREENTGKQVAIKFYSHRRGLDWSLLNREVEKLAVLYTSRNIIGLLDVGWNSDPPYYVMEYLENGSLAAFLQEGPLPADEAVRIAKSVLQALVHAHGSGILHCDLKPANVLLDSDFGPRLCDFGQSRLSYEQNPALGTLFYMAPEQANLKAVPDARWDVYALGALLYHMLCGGPPFRSAENEELIHSAEALEDRLAIYRRILKQSSKPTQHRRMPGVDKRLADIVDRCLSVDPKKRFPNAQAVLDMLEIRERQRSRRPLVALGFVGPLLLLAAMAFIVRDVMRNAVAQARSNVTERALEGDAHQARILAHSLERELKGRLDDLEDIAADPRSEARSAIENSNGQSWPQRKKLFARLESIKKRKDKSRRELSRDISWFVTDKNGKQIWRHPPSEKTDGKNYARRDYFHGLNKEYTVGPESADPVPPDIQPIQQPHISLAFRSEETKRFMVALSVPVWDEKHENVIGVLARTTHLGELLADYARSVQNHAEEGMGRSMALVDRRNWELLDHPWMAEKDLSEWPISKLRLSGPIVEKLNRLLENKGELHGDDRDDNYDDPVGQIAPDTYGGKWLAAFAPVGKTGWCAIVQEPRSAAVAPVDAMQSGLIRYGLVALGVSFGLILLLWYFVQRELNDGSLRFWTRGSQPRQAHIKARDLV